MMTQDLEAGFARAISTAWQYSNETWHSLPFRERWTKAYCRLVDKFIELEKKG